MYDQTHVHVCNKLYLYIQTTIQASSEYSRELV